MYNVANTCGYVIAHKTDEYFTKGEKYPIVSLVEYMVTVVVTEGVTVQIDLFDNDFTIMFGDTSNIKYGSASADCTISKPLNEPLITINTTDDTEITFRDSSLFVNCILRNAGIALVDDGDKVRVTVEVLSRKEC